ncbi:MAG: His/Gly/Thr/Pro-type tRNA ligase C-terminal domain-containing protein, partial [Thermoplasmata archaeon]
SIGLDPAALRAREHSPQERAHYSSETWDFEFFMDDEWIEIVGISDRNSYDLSRHQEASGQDMSVNGKIPHVIEPSHGIDRIFLSIMNGSYYRRENGYKVLKLMPHIAPYHFALFPLQKKDGLDTAARSMFRSLKAVDPFIFYDESGTIGRRYARQDEIGTPFCITVDYQTKEDSTVTVRERDSSKQERILFTDLLEMAKNYPDSCLKLFNKGAK